MFEHISQKLTWQPFYDQNVPLTLKFTQFKHQVCLNPQYLLLIRAPRNLMRKLTFMYTDMIHNRRIGGESVNKYSEKM